uniref:Carbonic anhydrase 7 n=1 Tax=Salvator merianae TaxID=96440 RepID=A0A8D0BWS7_SALMN
MTGHHSWGYGQNDGPSEWHKLYPVAQGNCQSPIDIIPAQAIYDPCLKPLSISYRSGSSLDISNNGHSVMVDFKDMDDKTGKQKESPAIALLLPSEWGIPGNPPVLHLVHWNAKKYMTFADAVEATDGLAVTGVFLEIGYEHASMNRLTDALYMVKYKGTKAQFKSFNPTSLLPPCLDYWTYPGSLTTPPLNESVTWIVLKEAIQISDKQMEKFRTLLFTTEEEERIQMVNNFRPPQPLKGRVVRASFKA